MLSILPPMIVKQPRNALSLSNRMGRPSSVSFFANTVFTSNRESTCRASRSAGR